MKTSLIFIVFVLSAASLAAQTISYFKLHGEYDLHTNSPTITVYYPDQSSTTVGTNWASWEAVTNGEIWSVRYPSQDCQSNAILGATSPVILNGIYTCIDEDGTNDVDIWIRLPVGYSGATYAFYIEPEQEWSLRWQCIEAIKCLPKSQPLSSLSLWGNLGSDYWFYGANRLAEHTIAGIGIGSDFGLAIWEDHTLSAFQLTSNANNYAQMPLPGSISNNVEQVACGDRHALALLDTGTIAAWGDNRSGQTTVPTNLTGVAAIACGSIHSLALLTNSTVAAWGSNLYGECDVPSGLSNVVQVAGGSYFSAALKQDGTVIAWGDDAYGATDVPSGLSDVVRISCGTHHATALKADGTAVSWGGGFSSPSLTNIVYMASSDSGDWFVTGDGSVTMAGSDNAVQMPWSVSNVVMLAARRTSHAIVSGPVILGIESAGGTNANVVWPAAVAGRMAVKLAIGDSWELATNTVKYFGEQKHIHVSGDSFNQFFRLTTNSTPAILGAGADSLIHSFASGGSSSTNYPPLPGQESMMMMETVQELNPMEIFLLMKDYWESLSTAKLKHKH